MLIHDLIRRICIFHLIRKISHWRYTSHSSNHLEEIQRENELAVTSLAWFDVHQMADHRRYGTFTFVLPIHLLCWTTYRQMSKLKIIQKYSKHISSLSEFIIILLFLHESPILNPIPQSCLRMSRELHKKSI